MKILITCIVLFGILVLTNALCGGPGSIAFAIDGSDSIRRADFARMINFTIQNIDSFELGNDRIRVGALVYSTSISSNGYFNLITDRTDIETQIKSFVQPKQGTRTDLAIKKLGEILQNGDTKVGVVITDGESLDSAQTIIEAEKLRNTGVTMIAVGIGSLVNTVELRGIAGSNALTKTISFSDLTSVTTLEEINRLLCQVIATTTTTTTTPPPPKKALCGGPGSIAIAIDGSDSITSKDFARMINFTIKNIDSFELGNDRIRVGALVYSNSVPRNGFFNLKTDRNYIETQIQRFVQPKDGSRTDLAIKKLGEILQNGGDTKVGVVITDGVSKHYTLTIAEAKKLRDAGVIMVAVGIGSNVDRTELRGIAGSASLVKMITLSDLTSVTTLEEIETLLCGVITTTPPPPPPTPTAPMLCIGCVISHGFGYNYLANECTKFVMCYSSVDSSGNQIVKATIKPCGFGTYWSQEKHTCADYKSTACKTNKCSGKHAGYKLPYLGCRSYLSCMNGLPVPMCCPSGQIFSGSSGGSCVGAGSNVCSNDVCLSNWVRPTVGLCTRTENKKDKTTYYELIHGTNILRNCAPGTMFSKDKCHCGVHHSENVAPPKACNPMIKQGGNVKVNTQGKDINLFIGLHGQYISTGPRNVDFTSSQNYAIFGAGGAKSEINFWSLANAHFADKFAVSFSTELTPYTGATGTVRKEQILDNCLCHSSVGENVVKTPSISIQVVKKQRNLYVFTAYLETSNAEKTLSITQTSYSGFLDIIMAYNGSQFVFKVGGQEVATQLTGHVKRRNTGLIFGRPTSDDISSHLVNFLKAKLKHIVIYDCITKSLEVDLINM